MLVGARDVQRLCGRARKREFRGGARWAGVGARTQAAQLPSLKGWLGREYGIRAPARTPHWLGPHKSHSSALPCPLLPCPGTGGHWRDRVGQDHPDDAGTLAVPLQYPSNTMALPCHYHCSTILLHGSWTVSARQASPSRRSALGQLISAGDGTLLVLTRYCPPPCAAVPSGGGVHQQGQDRVHAGARVSTEWGRGGRRSLSFAPSLLPSATASACACACSPGAWPRLLLPCHVKILAGTARFEAHTSSRRHTCCARCTRCACCVRCAAAARGRHERGQARG